MKVDASIRVEHNIHCDSSPVLSAAVFASCSIRQVPSKSNQYVLFIDQELHDSFVVDIIWYKSILEVGVRPTASVIKLEQC